MERRRGVATRPASSEGVFAAAVHEIRVREPYDVSSQRSTAGRMRQNR